MNRYMIQQLASQHQADLRRAVARGGHGKLARQASAQHRHHSHPVRRRAGWALISLGVRLAYSAGEE